MTEGAELESDRAEVSMDRIGTWMMIMYGYCTRPRQSGGRVVS